MIFQPVVVSGGSQAYMITNSSELFLFKNSAEPGEIVVSQTTSIESESRYLSITDESGNKIPFKWDETAPLTRAPDPAGYVYFVMPASNVTITTQ